MWAPTSHASPRSIAGVGVGQVGLAGAQRLDLRAGQDDARLERLVDGEVVAGSSVECDGALVAHGVAPRGPRRSGGIGRGRTNAGPMRAGVRVLNHPQGCPTRRPSPARWCSYAYCRSLHITSFRSRKPYPMHEASARATRARHGRRRASGRRSQPAPRPGPPRTSSARSRSGSVPAGTVAGRVTTTSGVRPVPWIQRLSGVSQRATVSLNAPPSPVSSCHCWMVPLPYDCSPTSVARFAVLERAGDDLARGGAAAVDQDDDLHMRVRGDPVGQGLGRDLVALGVLLPEDDARADELAGDLAGGRDVAAGIAAQVEHEPRPAGLEVSREGLDDLVGGRVARSRRS